MNKICIGKVITTHGIKGEIRIKSDIEGKSDFFKIGNVLMIGNDALTITSYRVHKGYDMVNFAGITDINEVLKYRGLLVYIDRDSVKLSNKDYVITDLIGLDVYFLDEFCGKIKDYMYNNNYYLLEVENNNNHYYIPYNDNFIESININERKVITKNIKDLIV